MTADRVQPSRGLLDTNILILWGRIERSELPTQMAISAVTLAELSAGVHSLPKDVTESVRAERIDLLQRAESGFDPIPFDVAAARAYGRISATVRAFGRSPRSRVADLMIASIAASRALPLYTTNPSDFAGLEKLVTVIPVPRPTDA